MVYGTRQLSLKLDIQFRTQSMHFLPLIISFVIHRNFTKTLMVLKMGIIILLVKTICKTHQWITRIITINGTINMKQNSVPLMVPLI